MEGEWVYNVRIRLLINDEHVLELVAPEKVAEKAAVAVLVFIIPAVNSAEILKRFNVLSLVAVFLAVQIS